MWCVLNVCFMLQLCFSQSLGCNRKSLVQVDTLLSVKKFAASARSVESSLRSSQTSANALLTSVPPPLPPTSPSSLHMLIFLQLQEIDDLVRPIVLKMQ